ncbi:MAG: cupin-like domain-containing protein [Pseudomonadota bacterium]
MNPRVEIDPQRFEPWKIQEVSHRLADHPLLQIDALVELGRRLEARKLVRTHNSDATAGSSFADAPKLHPNAKGAEATLAGIAEARAWMSLLNVQADPLYCTLVDEVLEELRPQIEPHDPGMCYRAGWIFVSSPGAVTPFHMDHEHNFILQIAGSKRLYAWDPFDSVVLSEVAQELFHDQHSRALVKWDESFRTRARVIDLAPGVGGYMPSTTTHMVENGEQPSVTMSFTYYTNSTRRRELLYRGNAQLRRWGFRPQPVGRSFGNAGVKYSLLSGFYATKSAARRALGLGVRDTGSFHAPA